MEYVGEDIIGPRKAAYYRDTLGVSAMEFKAEWIVPIGVVAALLVGVLIKRGAKGGIQK